MNIPSILNNEAFLDAPLDYKWDENASDFFGVDAKNVKLGIALWALNHKSTYGLVAALSEWIYWRLSRHINIPTIIPVLESHWASVIDKDYSYYWESDEDHIIRSVHDPVNEPIWTMLYILNAPRGNYYNGRFIINSKVDKLAMLARHITPGKKLFDNWLSNIIRKGAVFFPAEYDRAEIIKCRRLYKGKSYDSSHESAIPREFFFEPDYDYATADNAQLINQFLSTLDYQNNPYLNSPQDMIEAGFTGTPYQYKG